jgi:hypothetical protein
MAMALDPRMAAAPVLAGASDPVLDPPIERSSVLVGLLEDEVGVMLKVAEVMVALVLLYEGMVIPVPIMVSEEEVRVLLSMAAEVVLEL